MTKKTALLISIVLMISVSCLRRDVKFRGISEVNRDGSVNRAAELVIAPAVDETNTQDSIEAFSFYSEHYVPVDESLFIVKKDFADGILTVSWSGVLSVDHMPYTDYKHKVGEGSTALNSITVETRNRWLFRDYYYRETFADPVDTTKYFPLITEGLSRASDDLLESESLKGLRDVDGAGAILSDLRAKTGVDLLRKFLARPESLDSLTSEYESYFDSAGDSLAGLAGVKLSPDSAANLLENTFDAVWDTLMTDHPGIFGSYALGENQHSFRIEVSLPGCLGQSNADGVDNSIAYWEFDNTDIFAREKMMEVSARDWLWGNVIISLAVIIIILVLVLWPVRRRRA
jgi:hypothetical protein